MRLSSKGLDTGIDEVLDPKIRHVVNQWYSAYQQASLGQVATHYDELECLARFVAVVENKSLSHILADICYDGLRPRGRAKGAKEHAKRLVQIMNESDFGRDLINPSTQFKGWQKRVLGYLEQHGAAIMKIEQEVDSLYRAADVDVYDRNGRRKKEKPSTFLNFFETQVKGISSSMKIYQLSTVTGLLCGFSLAECRAFYGCAKDKKEISRLQGELLIRLASLHGLTLTKSHFKRNGLSSVIPDFDAEDLEPLLRRVEEQVSDSKRVAQDAKKMSNAIISSLDVNRYFVKMNG